MNRTRTFGFVLSVALVVLAASPGFASFELFTQRPGEEEALKSERWSGPIKDSKLYVDEPCNPCG